MPLIWGVFFGGGQNPVLLGYGLSNKFGGRITRLIGVLGAKPLGEGGGMEDPAIFATEIGDPGTSPG